MCSKSNLNMEIKQKQLKLGTNLFLNFSWHSCLRCIKTFFFAHFIAWRRWQCPLPPPPLSSSRRSTGSVRGQPAPFSLSRTRRSLLTPDEKTRVMQAYLDCPHQWQSTTGNKKMAVHKKKLLLSCFSLLIYMR